MSFTNEQLIGLGVVGLLALWYLKNRAADVGQAVNPVNPDNVFYQGTNAVGGALTGDEDFSLGVWIYEKLHGVDG